MDIPPCSTRNGHRLVRLPTHKKQTKQQQNPRRSGTTHKRTIQIYFALVSLKYFKTSLRQVLKIQ